MKLKVHPALCERHHECRRFAPEIYELDEDGTIALRYLEVPPELEHRARLGASCCPTHAITVVAG